MTIQANDLAFFKTKSTGVGHSESGGNNLGGYQAAERLTGKQSTSPVNVTGVTIVRVSGMVPTGSATLAYTFTGQTLVFTAPGDVAGTAVPVGAGGTFYIYSANEDYFLEVSVSAGSLPGSNQSDSLTISKIHSPDTIHDDITAAQSLAGRTEYRAMIVKNLDPSDVLTNLGIYIDMGLVATTLTAAYASSGAITISLTSGSGYPINGFWKNNNTGEIMYGNRSGNNVSIKAVNRGLRGSSAAAGSIGHSFSPYAWVDLALEALGSDNVLQTIASDGQAPTGLTWSYPTENNALNIGNLAIGGRYGVWARRIIPAGAFRNTSAFFNVHAKYE